jgi:hypothetical protein
MMPKKAPIKRIKRSGSFEMSQTSAMSNQLGKVLSVIGGR